MNGVVLTAGGAGVALGMRFVKLLLCLALFAGCDEIFSCRLDPASPPDKPVFDLSQSRGAAGAAKLVRFHVAGQPLCVREWTTFWDISVPSGTRYLLVNRLTYGEAPAGFEVNIEPQSLPSDYVYSGIPACHGLSEDCYFTITEDSSGTRVITPLTEEEFRVIINPGGG